MRIISKFHDYYDIGMSYGQDENLVWVRETEVVEIDTKILNISDRWFNKYWFSSKAYRLDVKEVYVALCGKIHPIHVGVFARVPKPPVKVITGQTYDEVRNSFTVLANNIVASSTESPPRYGWTPSERQAWLDKPCHNLHTFFDCPLLLIEKGKITKCPNLAQLNFQKIKDPYTLYQEIGMYISGVMGQKTNPTVTISDKSKIEKHGFDYKTSFRKGKSEKA